MSKRILILDDDAQVRESLRKALRAEGYDVVVAADGQEGVEKFRAAPVELLLLDLNLPEGSGWDIFERLTSMNPLVPTIIITGMRHKSDSAAMAGAGAFFEKPLDVPLLLRTMKELLAEPPESQLKRLAGLRSCLKFAEANTSAETTDQDKLNAEIK